ncbi:MAG TPA: hypothetical protein VFL57_12920, partial [Bryobacteraceae bacterium]|nr:hypothetical protein [Bryobacteraceae bacterium]
QRSRESSEPLPQMRVRSFPAQEFDTSRARLSLTTEIHKAERLPVLFWLKDYQGHLIIARTCSKENANAFGQTQPPEFCPESTELDETSRQEAGELWGGLAKHTWVSGPALPGDVEAGGLLTVEDHRDLTLDHIERTSAVIGQVTIVCRT